MGQYFGVRAYFPEEFFSKLESKQFFVKDINFVEWLEDKGFPTFGDLLNNCSANDRKTFMQLKYELEMLRSFIEDLSGLETDEDERADLRAYLINLVNHLIRIAPK